MGRQYQGMDRPGIRQDSKGNGEQGKMEETGCEIVCGAPTTLTVKGQMMITTSTQWSEDVGPKTNKEKTLCRY